MKHNHVGWRFDNSYARLPNQLFTLMNPTPVADPSLIIFNQKLSKMMGLNFKSLSDKTIAELLSGNKLPKGSLPLAQAYAGHQFGYFTVLGDGRAILLGEHLTPDNQRVDIHLKGAGKTPYSRSGDGRATLGPMLREYIISEAIYALGVPTTRSLAVIKTGEAVYRESKLEGAILVRIAESHIRVGTFQYAAMQQDLTILESLLDYTIKRHYPTAAEANNPASAFLKLAVKRQAKLVSEWMRIGFIHGVMNTDNMAMSGETIDYGPCAFMDEYDLQTVLSSIDVQGRYAFGNQAKIAQWNLARLAETLLPFLHTEQKKAIEIAEEIIHSFETLYLNYWLEMMRKKLGIFGEEDSDRELIQQLLSLMQENKMDYTNTFFNLPEQIDSEPTKDNVNNVEFKNWLCLWQTRINQNNKPVDASIDLMQANNPVVVPRNHHVEFALQSATRDDFAPIHKLLNVLATPYDMTPESKAYQTPPSPSEKVYQTFCGT